MATYEGSSAREEKRQIFAQSQQRECPHAKQLASCHLRVFTKFATASVLPRGHRPFLL